MFWGHVLEVFANGICVLAVQNTTPEMLRIGSILSDVCLIMMRSHLFHIPFFDDFYEEFICFFTKKSLKKGDPGRHTTPTVTRFRTGHLAEVVWYRWETRRDCCSCSGIRSPDGRAGCANHQCMVPDSATLRSPYFRVKSQNLSRPH